MEIAIGLPNAVRGGDRDQLTDWARAADEPAFSPRDRPPAPFPDPHAPRRLLPRPRVPPTPPPRAVSALRTNPAMVAKQMLSLDTLAGGGKGGGWQDRARGRPRDQGRRCRAGRWLDDALPEIRQIWNGGGQRGRRAGFGEYYAWLGDDLARMIIDSPPRTPRRPRVSRDSRASGATSSSSSRARQTQAGRNAGGGPRGSGSRAPRRQLLLVGLSASSPTTWKLRSSCTSTCDPSSRDLDPYGSPRRRPRCRSPDRRPCGRAPRRLPCPARPVIAWSGPSAPSSALPRRPRSRPSRRRSRRLQRPPPARPSSSRSFVAPFVA